MMVGKHLLKLLTYMALCCALVFTLAVLPSCSGDDGSTGPQGPPGPPGPAGEVTLQDLQNMGLSINPSDVTPINPVLDLTKTVSYDSASGTVTVHFFLTDGNGNGIDITKMPYEVRLYVSELIPANEPTPVMENNPGPAWNRLIYESGTPAMEGSELPGKLDLVSAATGEYNYTLADTLYQTDHVIRLTLVTLFRFRDNNGVYIYVANPVNASYDFLESDPGTPLASSGADMVTTAACQQCHGGEFPDHSRYTDVKTCNNCHNVNYMADHDPNADLAFLIHSIHAAKNFSVGDFSEVTYPQNGAKGKGDVFRCGTCHNGPQASLAYSDPTRMNCGSCHTNVDFATGAGHGGGAQTNDASCSGCHPPSAIQNYHDPVNNTPAADVPEFDVTITMTPQKEYYVAGDAPMVTVTLKNRATGQPVDPSVYTSSQGSAGQAGGGLNLASLYVYGPRSFAVPVLTTNSTTDPAFDPTAGNPTQGHPLFPGGTDPLVKTDANGYHYQLMAIPDSLTAGTYMVQFQGQDYGALSATNYVTTSVGKINFQVGTADIQHKVSGDACVECHDDTRMHAEGAHAHNVPFDTDYCLACHDKSGNHGDYIGNRVHAVHNSTGVGDYNYDTSASSPTYNLPRQWFEITFPQSANNCVICHTTGEVPQQIYMLACGGCHGVHTTDANGKPLDPAAVVAASGEVSDEDEAAELAKVTNEIAAAQHMMQNGGDADVDAQGGPHTLACLTCHGPGKIEDIAKMHNLNKFPPLPTPEP